METKIINKLKEYGIEIHKVHTSQEDGEIVIMAEDATIMCKKNNVFVSFHVITKPSFAARVILVLKEIKGIKLFVGEDFVFDEKGKFLDGEEALNYHKEYQKQFTINQFMQQQQQLYYLTNAKSYKC